MRDSSYYGAPCVPCGAVPTPLLSPSFSNGTLPFSSAGSFTAKLPSLPAGSADGTPCGFTPVYVWSLGNVPSTATAGLGDLGNSPLNTLIFPAGSLPPTSNPVYSVSVRACFAGPTLCSNASVSIPFAVQPTPLIISVSPAAASFTVGGAATLHGSAIDPDGGSGLVTLTWTCMNSSSLSLPSAPELDLSGVLPSLSAPGTYVFMLTAAKDVRSASAQARITLVMPPPGPIAPQLVVTIAPVTLAYINPSLPLTLSASATPAVAGNVVSLQWSISPLSTASATALGPGVLDDPCLVASNAVSCVVASTSTFSPTFALVPFALAEGGAVYTFRVTAVETGAATASVTAWADIQLPPVAPAPQGGTLALVGSSSGTALVTPFNVSSYGWSVGASSRRRLQSSGAINALDYPLSYRIAYMPASHQGAPITLIPSQAGGAEQFNASVYLPQGTWHLVVFVTSARGGVSSLADALASAQAVTVSEASAIQLAGAASTAAALAAANQNAEALQLAAGVAAALSTSPASAGNSAIISSLITNVINATLSGANGLRTLNASAADTAASDTLGLAASTLAALTSSACDLSNTSRTAALTAASSLASSASAISSTSTAQATLQSISNSAAVCPVQAQPVAATSCPGEQAQSATLTLAQSALSALIASALKTPSVTGGVGINLTSSLASIQVSSEYANSADAPAGSVASQLFSAGSSTATTSFGPLPADALANYNRSSVAVVLLTSAFNSYCESLSSSGTSRLEVVDPITGEPLPVLNLSVPISITLPQSSQSPVSQSHAMCAYWNPVAKLYSTSGCLGLPSPLPRGITASLNASLYNLSLASSTHSCLAPTTLNADMSQSARLLRTLQFAGPLLAGCTPTILDCPLLGSGGRVYLNPSAPTTAPAVACPQPSSESAADSCSCLEPPGQTALLVFTGASCKLWHPNNAKCFWNATVQSFQGTDCIVPPASAAHASTLPPSCLCTHLTDFSAFAAPSVPVASPAQMVSITPALALTKARVFLAIILALFCTMHVHVAFTARLDRRQRNSMRAMLFSRDFGFAADAKKMCDQSTNGWIWRLHASVDEHTGVLFGPAVRFAAAIGLPLARLQFALPEELIDFEASADNVNVMTSTALVYALIRVRLLIEPEELVRRQAESAELLGKPAPGMLGFNARVDEFTEMFGNQTLSRPSMWLACTRLWRIILLRRVGAGGGGWDPTAGLSFALYATLDETTHAHNVHPRDFGADLVLQSCPEYLGTALSSAGEEIIHRVWTTLLVCAVLSRISVCRLARPAENETLTLLDEADEWVRRTVAGYFGKSRADSLLHHAADEFIAIAHSDADEVIRAWRRSLNLRAERLRAVATSGSFAATGGSNVFTINRSHQMMGSVCITLGRRHEAFGTLFAPLSDGLTRSQRAALLLTTLLGLLCVDTWFYWARGTTCCNQIRALLACPPGRGPCLGYAGDCADLQAQFADFYEGGLQCPDTPGLARISDWKCRAFPDEESNRDAVLVGLIAAAVSLPLRYVLEVMLRLSNEAEHEHTWLFFHPVTHIFMRGLRRDWLSWRWRDKAPSWPVRYLLHYEMQPFEAALEALCDAVVYLFPTLTRRRGSGRVTLVHRDMDDALASAARRRAAFALGVLLVYITWALFVWFIVVYGIDVFTLVGSVSEYKFVRAWAIAAGVGQATQLRAILSVFSGGVLLHLADVLWVMPHQVWLESWLDARSVAATVAAGASAGAFVRAHVEHHRAVGYV